MPSWAGASTSTKWYAGPSSIGHHGPPAEQLSELLQSISVGVTLDPVVDFDESVLAARLASFADAAVTKPVNAKVIRTATGFSTVPSRPGARFDSSPVVAALTRQLHALDAPASIAVTLPSTPIAATITNAQALAARAAAAAMSQAIVLANSGDKWTIPEDTVHSWISFRYLDGALQPFVNQAAVAKAVVEVAKVIDREPVSASWDFAFNGVVVVPAKNGRAVDVDRTARRIVLFLQGRGQGAIAAGKLIGPTVTVTEPTFTTAEATAAASKFKLLSTWTTNFQPAAHNGYGANIWIPASVISGTVVQPGATFNFWDVVGPVTLERGYKLGGAIVNGHTEEGVAIGGGICSTSTTLFNAALRAGFQMGERSNHYYYITRYPVGLDATVSKSGNSSQNMTWTNDSPYPVLIKAFNGPGSVTFSLYGVPTGRSVGFTQPIISNYRTATNVETRTSALPNGRRVLVEYADNGFDASVTRVVRDASGAVIHQETYHSHYATIQGVVMVGDSTASYIAVPSYAPGAQGG